MEKKGCDMVRNKFILFMFAIFAFIFLASSASALTQISNCAQLQAMASNLVENYELTGNIDCTGFDFGPVGTLGAPFRGNFDGKGYNILNLRVNRPTSQGVGLFGYATDFGMRIVHQIKNVNLVNEYVAGTDAVGGLIGGGGWYEIINCSVTGTITGNGWGVGGFLGHHSTYYYNAYISDSYFKGKVKGAYWVGGMVGIGSYVITKSYTAGTVTATLSGSAGGFIGNVNSNGENPITDSYSKMVVYSPNGNSGGFIGHQLGLYLEDHKNSYFNGKVIGTVNSGGIFGVENYYFDYPYKITKSFVRGSITGNAGSTGAIIGNSMKYPHLDNTVYFDISNTGQTDCVGNNATASCTGVNSGNSQPTYFYNIANAPMNSWDFTNVWSNACNGIGTPILKNLAGQNCYVCGDGVVDSGEVCDDGNAIDTDACDLCELRVVADFDGDGIPDESDNCFNTYNPGQEDTDGDGAGDACDLCFGSGADSDSDGYCNSNDNCANAYNPGQEDTDGDGIGNACDSCIGSGADSDSDGYCDSNDNCPTTYNPYQDNYDSDSLGDLCDPCPITSGTVCNVDPSSNGGDEIAASSGGTVTTPSGETTVNVPAGALSADNTIVIEDTGQPIAQNGIGGGICGEGQCFGWTTVRSFGPSPMTFNQPIEVCITFNNGEGVLGDCSSGLWGLGKDVGEDGVFETLLPQSSCTDLPNNNIKLCGWTDSFSNFAAIYKGACMLEKDAMRAATLTRGDSYVLEGGQKLFEYTREESYANSGGIFGAIFGFFGKIYNSIIGLFTGHGVTGNVVFNSGLDSGLVSYWNLDGNANDIIGSNNGAVNGATFTEGEKGQAASFSGSGNIAFGDVLDVGSNSLTVSAWVKTSGSAPSNGEEVIGKGNSPYSWEIHIHENNGRFVMFTPDTNVYCDARGTSQINDGQWHQLTARYDGSRCSMWIDGVKEKDVGVSGTLSSDVSASLQIGQRADGWGQFDGSIDEVGIWNRALSDSEISSLHASYNAASSNCAAQPSGMVSWWNGNADASDSKGTNNGQLLNGATAGATPGQVSGAFSFNGNNYVSVPDSADFNFGSDDFSVGMWLYQTAHSGSGVSGVFTDGGTGYNYNVIMYSEHSASPNGGFYSAIYNNAGQAVELKGSQSISLNSWHYFVVSRTGDTVKAYMDGVEAASANVAGWTLRSQGGGVEIGREGAWPFTGNIDEVQVYKGHGLTQAEVSAIYNAGSAGVCSGGTQGPVCGNNAIEAGEQCDDGNTNNGDGCSATCQTETAGGECPGLVSMWDADTTGNAGKDVIDGNDGTLAGGLTTTAGKVGQALNFDGSGNQYVEMGSNPIVPNGPFSISIWAKPSSNRNGYYLMNVGNVGGIWIVSADDGTIYEGLRGSDIEQAHTSPGLITVGQWQHFVLTYNGQGLTSSCSAGQSASNYVLYVNGARTALTYDYCSSGNSPVLNNYIGKDYPSVNYVMNGLIDEVQIYDRTLSDSDVSAIYNAQSGVCKNGGTQGGCVNAPSGLISVWNADDSGNAGKDAKDGNDGILMNGATTAAGKIGNAFSLNGNNYVRIPASTNLNDVGKTALTVSSWVKLNSISSGLAAIITKHRQGNPNTEGWMLVVYNGNFYVQLRANGQCCQGFGGTTQVQAGQWYYVTETYDGSTLKLYVNGALEGSLAVSGDTSSTIDINLGADVNSNSAPSVDGLIDEVEVYDRALSESEIQTRYAAENAGTGVCSGGTQGPVCGNNAIETGEVCDGTALGGATCASVLGTGYTGTLSCSSCALVTSGCSAPASNCAAQPSGMVSWYNGNTDASDSKGTNAGTLVGSATAGAVGNVGGAFSFNGGYVQLSNEQNFDFENNQAFSIGAWVKTSSYGTQVILDKRDPNVGNYRGYTLILNAGNPFLGVASIGWDDGFAMQANVNVADGQWHYIVGQYDGSGSKDGVQVWVDGTNRALSMLVGSNTLSGTILNDIAPRIGAHQDPGAEFYGLIDEVQVYNKMLTASEISAIYSAGADGVCSGGTSGSKCDNVVSAWDADTAGNAGKDAVDGNDATLNGGISVAPGKVGNAFSLNGAPRSQYISVPSSADWNFGADDWAITTWINPTDVNYHSCLINNGRNQYSVILYTKHSSFGGTIYVAVSTTSGVVQMADTNVRIDYGSWQLITLTRVGDTLYLYKNGDMVYSVPIRGSVNDPVGDFLIADDGSEWGNTYAGKIDEFKIYKGAGLTQAEVQAIYDAGSAGVCKSGGTQEPVCGDGIVNQASENCDDGNTNNGDGCSSICQTECSSEVSFNHPANSGASVKDCITPNVCLTRGYNEQIYNSVLESSADGSGGISPRDTEWAYGTCANKDSMNFKPFIPAVNWHPTAVVGRDMCAHLISDNLYIDIKFDYWQAGGGGGFSYTRYQECPSECGNGAVEGREQCDDGNTASEDGCSSTCQTETLSEIVTITAGDGFELRKGSCFADGPFVSELSGTGGANGEVCFRSKTTHNLIQVENVAFSPIRPERLMVFDVIGTGEFCRFCADADGDGYGTGDTTKCINSGEDCNDANAAIHPGVAEVCDGIDNNCDGNVDEGVTTTFYLDSDGDGYGDSGAGSQFCALVSGYSANGGDCNDANGATYPGAIEECNGIDDNCANGVDEGGVCPSGAYYCDSDSDGASSALPSGSCDTFNCAPSGCSRTQGTDCDDTNAGVKPGIAEICNGIDDNCNSEIDEGVTTTFYLDSDSDGYGNANAIIQACSLVSGYSAGAGDCNDENDAINPSILEVPCNGLDDDCSGGDFAGTDADGDGYKIEGGFCGLVDCNDANAEVNPLALEICDGIDNDCDGSLDSADTGMAIESCELSLGVCAGSSHRAEQCVNGAWQNCDASNYDSLYNSQETCPDDGTDNNCDGVSDFGCTAICDADGDGYKPDSAPWYCLWPFYKAGDCNDGNALVHPGVSDLCNGIDDDCSAATGDGVDESWYGQSTSCGIGECSNSGELICSEGQQTNTCTPGTPAAETCDGLDNDCNNVIDNGVLSTFYYDADGDGYGRLDTTLQACTAPIGYKAVDSDCDDSNAAIHLGATEVCDGIDNNCDGVVDEASVCPYGGISIVDLHTINLAGGSSTKSPLANAQIRVFDRNSPAFQAVAGSKNPSGDLYGAIYEADAGKVGACTTDALGACMARTATAGQFLVLIKYYDSLTGKTIYIGRLIEVSDFVNGVATKDFQVIKVFKKNVFVEYRGGSKIVVTGSLLEAIVPDSSVWEGTIEVYPFIFTSDSDWTVDVCAQVPSGYTILGIYDAEGNIVPSGECTQTFVNGETKVVAFQVAETGSPEPNFKATLNFKHKGKTTTHTVEAKDVRKYTHNKLITQAKLKAGKK